MKGIVITSGNVMRVQDFGEPLYKTVGDVVGGYIEHVHPAMLRSPYCMIVNEDGLFKCHDVNIIGSALYGCGTLHSMSIFGNIVIMKDGYVNGEPDIVGLEDDEIVQFCIEFVFLAEQLGINFRKEE